MVKVRFQLVSTDDDAGGALQGWDFETDEPLLDGPVMCRLGVVDIDPVTTRLRRGARLMRPGPRARLYRYRIADPTDPESEGFAAVSSFATVLRTIRMFEEADVLGRRVAWGFAGEQLLIVPQAGFMANAFYHRGSRSLQFFSYEKPGGGHAHTCLSPDIVVHEATHAIVDGIVPDLYSSTSPQALALHEAMADLATVVNGVRTARQRNAVLARTGGDLRRSTAFNEIAPALGRRNGGGHPLRDLGSPVTLARGGPNPRSQGPHDMSLIISSAMFALLPHTFRRRLAQALGQPDWDFDQTLGLSLDKAHEPLRIAAEILKRVSFRALDYLPPGEVGFADYARAVIAADRIINPDDAWLRDFLTEEFIRRGMVSDAAALEPITPAIRLPRGFDLDQLVASDWAAWRFCEKHRAALMIPRGAAFDLRPRIDARRVTWRGGSGRTERREVLLKLVWTERIMAHGLHDTVKEIAILRGTTLAIDRDGGTADLMLTTSPLDPSRDTASAERAESMRRNFLQAAFAQGLLGPGSDLVEIANGVLHGRGLGQLLHMHGTEDWLPARGQE